jgi:hypothetical protein
MPGQQALRRIPCLVALVALLALTGGTRFAVARALATGIVYSQPPKATGGILPSSLRDPDGSATDQWVWDGFIFSSAQTITEIRWRGAYDPARFGSGGPVVDFTIDIYPSSANGAQPDVAHPPLEHYEVGGNAGEVRASLLGGAQTYDYRFTLPAPFEAAGQKKYWVQIEAYQAGAPDWGLSVAASGDGYHFRRIPGQGANYQVVAGDAAFSLLGPLPGNRTIYLPVTLSR